MRFHRVSLKDFRAVTDCAVDFAESGVTIIEGDNEVGKSSIAEAIELLFDYPDDSKSATVQAVKPVHRDVSSSVTLEASAGPYRFTYTKRFHRSHATELQITSPAPEQLTGREAHNRVKAILAETVDEPLWKALRLEQGEKLEQANLTEQTSLGAALDAAASGALAGERENSLLERVRAEYLKYYTKTGKDGGTLQGWAKVHEVAKEERDRIATELAKMERDIERHATLSQEVADLGTQQASATIRLAALESAWRKIERQVDDVHKLLLDAQLAKSALELARGRRVERQRLISAVDERLRQSQAAESELERTAPALAAQLQVHERAREEADLARRALAQAQEDYELREADSGFHRDLHEAVVMRERLERVEEAQPEMGEIEAFLDACTVDDAKIADIEKAEREVVAFRARLEGDRATLEIRSAAPLQFSLQGKPARIDAPEPFRVHIIEPLAVELPGGVDLLVSPGASVNDMTARLLEAEDNLLRLCVGAGSTSPEHARELNGRRERSEQQQAGLKKRVREDLRDLTPSLLAEKLRRMDERVVQYRESRVSDPPLPQTLEAAKRIAEGAGRTLKAARAETASGENVEQASRDAYEDSKLSRVELELQVKLAQEAHKSATAELATSRADEKDEEIEERLELASEEASAKSTAHVQADQELKSSNPEGAHAEYLNAVQLTERLAQELRKAEDALRDVQTSLSILGETGLHDRLDVAETRLLRAERERVSGEARARAAKLLFDTLNRHRAEARRAYVTPFKEKLEGLGRIVFGPRFSLEIDENLSIRRRTLDGITVEFKELSTGAREQLSVLARLACAALVSASGGVPLILDDALGWSDPGRLEKIAAAFTVGSRDCQVIVLTCTPGRYRKIGGATVVRLPA